MYLDKILEQAKEHFELGKFPDNKSHLEIALLLFQRSLEIDSDNSKTHLKLGNTFLLLKRLEDAILSCDKAIHLDPYYSEAYNFRGLCYYVLKNPLNDAIAEVTHAIDINPNCAYYHNRGRLYKGLRKFHVAIADFSVAIKLDPAFLDPYPRRGECYENIGDLKSAEKDYEKAMSLFDQRKNLEFLGGRDYDETIHDYVSRLIAESGLVRLGCLLPGVEDISQEILVRGFLTQEEIEAIKTKNKT